VSKGNAYGMEFPRWSKFAEKAGVSALLSNFQAPDEAFGGNQHSKKDSNKS